MSSREPRITGAVAVKVMKRHSNNILKYVAYQYRWIRTEVNANHTERRDGKEWVIDATGIDCCSAL